MAETDKTSDSVMYCTTCHKNVQAQGTCPKNNGGPHHLISISDKGVQGQGDGPGPESEKSSEPADPANYQPKDFIKHKDVKTSAKVSPIFHPIRYLAMQYVAHDSGDGQTIFHCGAAETKYWTYDGLKTLGETVGTVQKVLTNTGSGGVWRDAIIHSFGEQHLMKVTVRRNGTNKELFFTPEHRWMVRKRNDPKRSEYRIVETQDLLPGDKLSWLLPKSYIKDTTPSNFGIAAGIVFGDGTKQAQGSVVRLWGEKDAQLIKYFNENKMYPEKTSNGVLGVRIVGLPTSFKDRPSLDEGTAHLYGWLAGYFAADGCVGKDGSVVLHSASKENLEFAQLVAMRLGIATYDIKVQSRLGYGSEPSDIYKLSFIASTLRPDFFLIKEHRERFDAKIERGNPESFGWTVVSVEETDRFEEVFCPRVPEYENFVLDGLINTQNCPFCGSGQVVGRSDGTVECNFCKTCFTVQVQPEQMGMPQTVNGQPYQMPGMPYGQDPNEAAGLVAPADPNMPPDGPPQDPGEQDPDGSDLGSPQDEEDQDSSKDSAPWMRESKKYYLVDGGVLNTDDYARHLAIKYAEDPAEMIRQIRNGK